jgi:hypothetical protein
MNFQNIDIQRHIMSFGYPGYREDIQQICRDIKAKTWILKKVPDRYPETDGFINSMNLKMLFTEYFKHRHCRCCSRHSHNKPDLQIRSTPKGQLYFYIVYNDEWFPECKNLHDCKCDCRHETRMICGGIAHRARKPSWS